MSTEDKGVNKTNTEYKNAAWARCKDGRYDTNQEYAAAIEELRQLGFNVDITPIAKYGGIFDILQPDKESGWREQIEVMDFLGQKSLLVLSHLTCHFAKRRMKIQSIAYTKDIERKMHIEAFRKLDKMFHEIIPDGKLYTYLHDGSMVEEITL